MAYRLFHNYQCHHGHQVAQVTFRAEAALMAEVPQVLPEVDRFICTSSGSVGSVLCHCGMKGSRKYDFHETLLGFFLSQASPCYAQETELLASSLLGLCCDVASSVLSIPLSLRMKTLLWPFWPYSRKGTCWTVLAVPNHPASP